jgi:hypothetical protein
MTLKNFLAPVLTLTALAACYATEPASTPTCNGYRCLRNAGNGGDGFNGTSENGNHHG